MIPMNAEMTITQWHVPVDDFGCYWYSIFTSFTTPVDKKTMREQRLKTYPAPDYKPIHNRANGWGFDAEQQRKATYTGMGFDINIHDQFACESPGRIADRTQGEPRQPATRESFSIAVCLLMPYKKNSLGEKTLMMLDAAAGRRPHRPAGGGRHRPDRPLGGLLQGSRRGAPQPRALGRESGMTGRTCPEGDRRAAASRRFVSPSSTSTACCVRSRLPRRKCGAALENGVGFPSSLLAKDTSNKTVFPVFTAGAGFGMPEMEGAADALMVADAVHLARPALGAAHRLAAVRPQVSRRQAGAVRHARPAAAGARRTGPGGLRLPGGTGNRVPHLSHRRCAPAPGGCGPAGLAARGGAAVHRLPVAVRGALRPARTGAGDSCAPISPVSACRCAASSANSARARPRSRWACRTASPRPTR